jgi:hypothetical protein
MHRLLLDRAARVVLGLVAVGSCLGTCSEPVQAETTRIYTTARTDKPPHIDGRLDDAVWDKVEWGTDFVQYEPAEGEPPRFQTAFKILYDNHALYIAYRAYDNEPYEIFSELARRDWFAGDWVEINIDSYNDKRSAFSFTASVSGSRSDEFISDDGDEWDESWDPVWKLRTQIDYEGWTAEIMIPLSQLRFADQPELVWGIQVQRLLFRDQERSVWQPISKDDTGWVSRFGELRGIRGVKPRRRIELLPYALGKVETYKPEPGDPYYDGRDGRVSAGLDGKLGVTHDLTLDFTFNPDFGQVEADPSVVNLSAFETFYDEKRPFFIEGNNILSFSVESSSEDNLFYSRRIGREPSVDPDYDDDEYAKSPDNTSIIGAFKLTGKTRRGLSVGILESVTAREQAIITDLTTERKETIEPLSNYFVGRLQQDLRDGSSTIGAMFTATNRQINKPELLELHRSAYTGGIDVLHQWSDNDWFVSARGAASQVRGDERALIETQRSSQRYFQRPDNHYERVDSTRTSLSGHGGSVLFGRSGGGDWRFETGVTWRSPGFEINDLGYQESVDFIDQSTWVGYSKRNQFAIFRSMEINGNQSIDWDFGGTRLGESINGNFSLTFVNNWSVGAGATLNSESISNDALRGGPSFLWPGSWDANVSLDSDTRKLVYGSLGGSHSKGGEDYYDYSEIYAGLTVRPTNALRLSLNVSYSREAAELQYVDETDLDDDPRYIFGSLEQKTVPVTVRMDWTLTPNLTLQFYGSPFVSAGKYTHFKRITNPRAPEYRDRFQTFRDDQIILDDENDYLVDETGDGDDDYEFENPDFNIREFNSNLVLRWEFQPGSTLYLVWNQYRASESIAGTLNYRKDSNRLFEAYPENVFLLKVNKWFSL